MSPRAPRGGTNTADKLKTRASPRRGAELTSPPAKRADKKAASKASSSRSSTSTVDKAAAVVAQKAAEAAMTPRRRGRPPSSSPAPKSSNSTYKQDENDRESSPAVYTGGKGRGKKKGNAKVVDLTNEETQAANSDPVKNKRGKKKLASQEDVSCDTNETSVENASTSELGEAASEQTATPQKADVVVLPTVEVHKCEHCPRFFNTLQGKRTHESRCKSNPRRIVTEKIPDNAVIDLPNTSVDPSKVTINKELKNEYYSSPFENDDDDDEDDLIVDPLGENVGDGSPPPPIPVPICPCCGDDFATAHQEGEYQCGNCQSRFKEKASLQRHIKTLHLGTGLDCPQCGVKCPDKGTLARHLYTHTGLKPYSCKVCKQEFSRKYHLVRHNTQTGCDGKAKPTFPCQVCGRSFSRKDNLRDHLRHHMGETKRPKKAYICETCGDEFPEASGLQAHRKTHAGERHYYCDFCPKRFPSSGAMKKHRRTHTGERPYECQTCHKCFAAKETLNRHVRIHTGHKPHACNYCGKRFIQSSQLRSHLFYHTGGPATNTVLTPTETFSCELCGKKFNRRARLNEHIKFLHLGAKPFECALCPKTFIRKEDLNRHMVIHSGVKAHKCPICGKSFAMKSSLKVHLLTHTKEPPRSCDECGRAFIRQDCLLRHMRNKHRDMLEEIRSEAEKKKLQQQLLQVAAEASLVEGLEDREELDDNGLTEAVRELLTLLVDEATLKGLGWPTTGVEALLEAVIRRCGHEPAPASTPHHDRLRHNVKLLFTVVIDDSAVKALLNNQTVDEVILHVLRLAKS